MDVIANAAGSVVAIIGAMGIGLAVVMFLLSRE